MVAKGMVLTWRFSFQPSDLMKIVLILILAKYFSRRHVAIGQVKASAYLGAYALAVRARVP